MNFKQYFCKNNEYLLYLFYLYISILFIYPSSGYYYNLLLTKERIITGR